MVDQIASYADRGALSMIFAKAQLGGILASGGSAASWIVIGTPYIRVTSLTKSLRVSKWTPQSQDEPIYSLV